MPGWALGYNNTFSYNWRADSGNRWTVPIGFSLGKTFDMGGGHGLDINGGTYWMLARPEGAPDFQVKFGLTWLFP